MKHGWKCSLNPLLASPSTEKIICVIAERDILLFLALMSLNCLYYQYLTSYLITSIAVRIC